MRLTPEMAGPSDGEGELCEGRSGPSGPPLKRQRVSFELEDGSSRVSSVPSGSAGPSSVVARPAPLNSSQPCSASSGAIPKQRLPPAPQSLPPPPPPPQTAASAAGGRREVAQSEEGAPRCCLKICTLQHSQIVKFSACGHSFFRHCLAESILNSEEEVIRCPASVPCNSIIPPAKIQEILSPLEFSLYQSKEKTYQCRTPGCEAWVAYRKTPRGFQCPACKRVNCLMCKDIHTEKPCEFLEDILNYPNEKNTDPIKNLKDKKVDLYPTLLDLHTLELVLYPESFKCSICFEEYRPMEGVILKQCLHVFCRMIRVGEAMRCPQCAALITKIGGCDGMICPFCRLEICWVTKKRRWGPGGKGDFSGGCQCNWNRQKCHPACGNCH